MRRIRFLTVFAVIGMVVQAGGADRAATQLAAKNLYRRWSFNGNLRDAVTGQSATAVGRVTLENGMFSLPGGPHGTGYVNLGRDVLPKDGAVTIEVWAMQLEPRNWSRIFDIGTVLEDSMLMSWTCGTEVNSDGVCIKKTLDAKQMNNRLWPYTPGKMFHIAMTLSPRSDGCWNVACYKQKADTGRTLKSFSFTTTPGWSPKTQNQTNAYLGHSCAPADSDAKASYDEVRVWRCALSEAELVASARLGPDAAPGDGLVSAELLQIPPPKENPVSPLHSQVKRTGNWQGAVAKSKIFGNYAWATEDPDGAIELVFEGTRCEVHYHAGARHWKELTLHIGQNAPLGTAEVFVDGRKTGRMETASGNGVYLACDKLPLGRHTVRLVNTVPKNEFPSRLVIHGFVVDRPQSGREPDWSAESESLAAAARKLPPIVFFTGVPYQSGAIPNVIWQSKPLGGKWGCSIRVYDPSQPDKPARTVWEHPNSLICDLSTSFDAKRIYFSMRYDGSRAWQIYSVNADGSGFRRITDTPDAHNVSPAPLPDGNIAFISSRTKGYHTVCQSGPSTHVYVMDADGGNAKRLSSNTLSDFYLSLRSDGRLMYTRWEYVDWNLTYRQSLWTQYPDGRLMSLWFGNLVEDPGSFIQAAEIPGTPDAVCTFAPHHGSPYGAIGLVSTQFGPEGAKGVAYRVLTPEFPATDDLNTPWAYCWPYPAPDSNVLCSYGGGGLNRYRICLIDRQGNRATVYDAKNTSAFGARPLIPRTPPPLLAEFKPANAKTFTLDPAPPGQPERETVGVGYLFVSDVRRGYAENVTNVQSRYIRVMEQLPKTVNRTWDFVLDQGPLMSSGTYYAKRVWGYAPIEDDGSCYFEVPALKEIYLQLVDAEGREIQRMTSAINVMPGERQGCAGCHENRRTAAAPAVGKAARRAPTPITLPEWGNAGVLDYRTVVQPVFDRHCVKCHSGPNPPKGVSLNGNFTRFFCMSYDCIVNRSDANNQAREHFSDPSKPIPLVDCNRLLTGIGDPLRPMDSGSFASRLPRYFERGHCGADVPLADRRRIYEWIDAMVPYYPTSDYAHIKAKSDRDKWGLADGPGLLPWYTGRFEPLYRKNCASCHGGIRHNGYEWQSQWAWIDLTKPEWSPALTAHLPKAAGGRGLPANGKFQLASKADPLYIEMLEIFQSAAAEAAKTPEADMPGFVPRSRGKGEFRIE